MILLLLTTTTCLYLHGADDRGCTRMSADARGGEPRRGESDGTSSISHASDGRGFPRMPGEVRAEARWIRRILFSSPENTKKILKNTLLNLYLSFPTLRVFSIFCRTHRSLKDIVYSIFLLWSGSGNEIITLSSRISCLVIFGSIFPASFAVPVANGLFPLLIFSLGT